MRWIMSEVEAVVLWPPLFLAAELHLWVLSQHFAVLSWM